MAGNRFYEMTPATVLYDDDIAPLGNRDEGPDKKATLGQLWDDYFRGRAQTWGDGRYSALGHTHTLAQISDMTPIGRALASADSPLAARIYLGAQAQVPEMTEAEAVAGTGTEARLVSPRNLAVAAATHGGGGGGTGLVPMTAAEGIAGVSTAPRSMSAAVLKEIDDARRAGVVTLVRPTLQLDFTRMALDPRIQFTRAGAASYWDRIGRRRQAASNVWPLDHRGATGSNPARDVWGAVSNVWLHSGDLANAAGTSRAGLDGASAPDADGWQKLLENANNGPHYIQRTGLESVAAGAVYTHAIDVRPGERRYIAVRYDGGSTGLSVAHTAYFDLLTGSIVGGTPDPQTWARIERIPDGWRIYTTITATQAGVFRPLVLMCEVANSFAYQGVAGYGLFVRAPQFGPGQGLPPYILTGAAAVTRPAEQPSMPVGDWYNPREGTWLVDCGPPQPQTWMMTATRGDGITSGPRVRMTTGASGTRQAIVVDDSNQQSAAVTAGAPGMSGPSIFAYAPGELAGAGVGQDFVHTITTPVGMPSGLAHLAIGHRGDGQSQPNTNFRRLVYWPRRLPNDVLLALRDQ